MSGSVWGSVGWAALWAALACLVWAAAGFALAHVLGRNSIVDTLWGLGFCLVAAVDAIVAGTLGSGDGLRRSLLLVAVFVWGVRLASHVGRRAAGKGEDPRYTALLETKKGSPTVVAIRSIYLPQALTVFIVSLPVQIGMVERGPVRWIGWLGFAVWAFGLVFEALGDAQMTSFKADSDNKGKIADVGLWSYTRHPNYFGDATVWVGIFLVAVDRWPGILSMVGPAVMVYLLAFGTGKRLLEKSMKDRPGYGDYVKRTSGFIPMPHRLHEQLTRG